MLGHKVEYELILSISDGSIQYGSGFPNPFSVMVRENLFLSRYVVSVQQ